MILGLKHDRFMDGVLPGKFCAQIPNINGRFATEPADSEVCVMILGVRSNQ